MSDAETYILIVVAAIVLLLDVWAISSIFRSQIAFEAKVVWAIGLVLFPGFGLVIWRIHGTEIDQEKAAFCRALQLLIKSRKKRSSFPLK